MSEQEGRAMLEVGLSLKELDAKLRSWWEEECGRAYPGTVPAFEQLLGSIVGCGPIKILEIREVEGKVGEKYGDGRGSDRGE